MEFDKKQFCKLNGRRYPKGAEIVSKGHLLDCVEGRWEEVILVSGI